MPLNDYVAPWSGAAYRHIAEGIGRRILDFSRAGLSADNRWNERGEPTLYLAGDKGVVVAEVARHIEETSAPALAAARRPRRIYRLRLAIPSVLDLCNSGAWTTLSLSDAPACFLDRARARSVARFVRLNTDARAIRVPSMAFLDRLDRWVMVLFLEKLPPEPAAWVIDAEPDELLRLGP